MELGRPRETGGQLRAARRNPWRFVVSKERPSAEGKGLGIHEAGVALREACFEGLQVEPTARRIEADAAVLQDEKKGIADQFA